MKLFIDAYNYLKQDRVSSYIDDRQRHAFIALLHRYMKRKKAKLAMVYAVFDGGDYPYERFQRGSRVTAVYAGYASSADEWLIDHAHSVSQAILVTSDSELRHRCAALGWYSISSSDFYQIVSSVTQNGSAEYDQQVSGDHSTRRLNDDGELSEFDQFMYQVAEFGVPLDTTQPEELVGKLEKRSRFDKHVEKILKYLL